MKYQILSEIKESFLNSSSLYYWHVQQDIIKNNKFRLRNKSHLLKIY